MAITLTNDKIRKALAAAGLPTPAPNRLHLLGVRSAAAGLPVGGATTIRMLLPQDIRDNEYNDTLIVFGTALQLFRCSVDPGDTYTQDPLNPEGCAHLMNGHYTYRLGTHKGHPALVQAAPVTVWRDRDKDGRRDPGEKVETGWFGINIHAGGQSEQVGPNSAGCQVVWGGWSGQPWTAFYDLCHRAGQDTFTYDLIDAVTLFG